MPNTFSWLILGVALSSRARSQSVDCTAQACCYDVARQEDNCTTNPTFSSRCFFSTQNEVCVCTESYNKDVVFLMDASSQNDNDWDFSLKFMSDFLEDSFQSAGVAHDQRFGLIVFGDASGATAPLESGSEPVAQYSPDLVTALEQLPHEVSQENTTTTDFCDALTAAQDLLGRRTETNSAALVITVWGPPNGNVGACPAASILESVEVYWILAGDDLEDDYDDWGPLVDSESGGNAYEVARDLLLFMQIGYPLAHSFVSTELCDPLPPTLAPVTNPPTPVTSPPTSRAPTPSPTTRAPTPRTESRNETTTPPTTTPPTATPPPTTPPPTTPPPTTSQPTTPPPTTPPTTTSQPAPTTTTAQPAPTTPPPSPSKTWGKKKKWVYRGWQKKKKWDTSSSSSSSSDDGMGTHDY